MKDVRKNILLLGNGFRSCCFKNGIDMSELTKKMNLSRFIPEKISDSDYKIQGRRNYIIDKHIERKIKEVGLRELFISASENNYELFLILISNYHGIRWNFFDNTNISPINEILNEINRHVIENVTELEIDDYISENDFLKKINIEEIKEYDEIWTTNYDNSVELFLEINGLANSKLKVKHIHGDINNPLINTWTKILIDYADNKESEFRFKNKINLLTVFGLSPSTDWIMFDKILNMGSKFVMNLVLYYHTEDDKTEVEEFAENCKGRINGTSISLKSTKIFEIPSKDFSNLHANYVNSLKNEDAAKSRSRELENMIHEWLIYNEFKLENNLNNHTARNRIYKRGEEVILLNLRKRRYCLLNENEDKEFISLIRERKEGNAEEYRSFYSDCGYSTSKLKDIFNEKIEKK